MAARQTANTVRATRPRRTTPVSDIERFFLQFCTSWRTASTEGRKRDKARDVIKEWFEKGGDADHEVTVNDQGSQLVEFEDAVVIDGVRITGLENVRRQSDDLDLDKVDAWLDSLPEDERAKLAKKLYKPVTDYVFQQDALYALNQAGVLSDVVLDSLFTTNITWALTVKKD